MAGYTHFVGKGKIMCSFCYVMVWGKPCPGLVKVSVECNDNSLRGISGGGGLVFVLMEITWTGAINLFGGGFIHDVSWKLCLNLLSYKML